MSNSEFNNVHVLIVTFDRDPSITLDQYNAMTNEAGPHWATLDGLIFKFFCATDNDTKGMGIYFWESQENIDAYYESEIYKNFVGIPLFSNWNKTVYRIQEKVSLAMLPCLKKYLSTNSSSEILSAINGLTK